MKSIASNWWVWAGLALASCTSDLVSSTGSNERGAAETATTAQQKLQGSSASSIPNHYIVVLKPAAARRGVSGRTVADMATSMARVTSGRVYQTYQHALDGYALETTADLKQILGTDSNVAYVVPDGVVSASDEQLGATWGLDRIDQRLLPLNTIYSHPVQGQGVHAYIIDTGIRATHADFALPGGGSRIAPGVDMVDNDANPDDCHGHGTHVAGTVGGTTWGVAKQVTLHGVRVLDCGGSGTFAGVIAGIDWVTANHVKPAVANMSLGGGFNQAVNDAVTNSIAAGVTYAIAAGNESTSACTRSPASTPNAITVGATTIVDARASFSNFGTCVDIFAPGQDITSAWITSDTATNTISGTSMATPHTAGVAALFLGANPTALPEQVASVLSLRATPDLVTNPGAGSPNRLLFMGNILGNGDNTPPEAAITAPANGSTVTGTVTVTADASDNVGVSGASLHIDGVAVAADTAAPWTFTWNTLDGGNGAHQVVVKAFDANGNVGASAPITVTVANPGQAAWDPARQVPLCASPAPHCTTGGLVVGRGVMSPAELNEPNTINDSCADGAAGTFHSDESLDRLRIFTVDGSNLAPGKAARIEATVWVWGMTSNFLDLFYTGDPDATPVVWTAIAPLSRSPGNAGAFTYVVDFTIPSTATGRLGLRGGFRFVGEPGECTVGSFNDRDDLIVALDGGTTPPVNVAPTVSAGPDLTVTLPATAALDGTVTDDGRPNPPAAVTSLWTQVSGPAPATFANAGAVDTTASFSTAGTYVFRLSASDSVLSAMDDVVVIVAPSPPVNGPPAVNAGPDQAITLPQSTAALDGTATDDGLPNPPALTTTWSRVSGPATVTFTNAAAVDTTATFTVAGTYVLRLTASDGALTASDDVQVVVNPVAATSLKVQYRTMELNVGDNHVRPWFNVVNTGGTTIPLSELKIRYWYTVDTQQAQTSWCDWAQVSCSNVTRTFVTVNPTRPNADRYLEVGFAASAGSLAPGAQTGSIQLRFNKNDWSNFNENNDHSYAATIGGTAPLVFTDWTRVGLYRNGVLIWGVAP